MQQQVAYVPYEPARVMQPVQQILVPAPAPVQPEAKGPKTARDLIEEEELETPANSAEFAEYYQNHAKKVTAAKGCLSVIATLLMVVSCVALFFIAMSFMQPKASVHRLKSSNGPTEGNSDVQNVLKLISAMIWGLVASKAK